MALLAVTLTGGVAMADHPRWQDPGQAQGGVIVTPSGRSDRYVERRYSPRYDRRYDRRHDRTVVVHRTRPVYRNNRYYFSGGFHRPYVRPVFNVRYRDYYQRPAVIVENMQPVAGYVWIPGQWHWDGYEWRWTQGRYEVDTAYQQPYYDNRYDNSGYDSGAYYGSEGAYYDPAPTVQGSVSGSWSF